MATHCVIHVREFQVGPVDENSPDAIEGDLDKWVKVVTRWIIDSCGMGTAYIVAKWLEMDDNTFITKISEGERFVTKFIAVTDDLERAIVRANEVGIETTDDVALWKNAWHHINQWTESLRRLRTVHSDMFGQV